MPLLIDTNIAIHLRDGDADVTARIVARRERPAISLVTLVELEGGIYAHPERIEGRKRGVVSLLRRVTVEPVDRVVVEAYGNIARHLGFSRRLILDRLIAATAIVHDLTLVTINGDDFRDIPRLRLEAWPAPAQ
ncbi:PIN domain-containing protein [Sphingomonas sp.]|uniref:PIN domain-containing protein n=1 Tax=Sphingomonas sp. TaxID=28214 RepID=UPI0035BBBBAF